MSKTPVPVYPSLCEVLAERLKDLCGHRPIDHTNADRDACGNPIPAPKQVWIEKGSKFLYRIISIGEPNEVHGIDIIIEPYASHTASKVISESELCTTMDIWEDVVVGI